MVSRCATVPVPCVRHRGRGLCQNCYARLQERGQLDQFPRFRGPVADHRAVVDAYLELAESGLPKIEIARRIGVSRGVLYAAIAEDPRTRPAPHLDAEEIERLRRLVGAEAVCSA